MPSDAIEPKRSCLRKTSVSEHVEVDGGGKTEQREAGLAVRWFKPHEPSQKRRVPISFIDERFVTEAQERVAGEPSGRSRTPRKGSRVFQPALLLNDIFPSFSANKADTDSPKMGSPCHGYAGLSRQQSAADIIAASDQRLNSLPQRAMNQASGQSGFSPARGHAGDTQKVNAATPVRNNDRAAGVLTTSLDLRSYYEREGSPNKYRNLGRKIGAADLDSEEQEIENEALENGTSVTPTVDAMIDSHIALEKSRLQLSPRLNGQTANELGSTTRNQIHTFQPSPTLAPNGLRFPSPSVKGSLQPEPSSMEQLQPDFQSTENKFLGAASIFKLQPPQKAQTLSQQLDQGVHQARTQAKNELAFPEQPARKAADIVSVTSVTSSTASMPAAGAVRHCKFSSKRRIEAPPERFNTYFVSPQGTPNSWKVASCYAIDYNPSFTPVKKQGLPSVIRHTTDPRCS